MKKTMRNLNFLIGELESTRFSYVEGMSEAETQKTYDLNEHLDFIIENIKVMYGATNVLGNKLSKRTRNACLRYMLELDEIVAPDNMPDNWFEEETLRLTRYHLRIVMEDQKARVIIRGLGAVGANELRKVLLADLAGLRPS